MLQLNFYPHLDLYHTAFRATCIGMSGRALHIDGYRLVDFFLTFPFELKIIRLRGGKLRKLSERFEVVRPYKWNSDPAYTFLQMYDFQTVALKSLAQQSIVDSGELERDHLALTEESGLAEELVVEARAFLAQRQVVVDVLLEIIDQHGITGSDGLKARSGLMPHKYDVDDDVFAS